MDYFLSKPNKKGNKHLIYFLNSMVSSIGTVPGCFEYLNVDVQNFVNKANMLFNKYKIRIPNQYPRDGIVEKEGEKVFSFPQEDQFYMCILYCINIEEKYNMRTLKILKNELIKPNSRRNIVHACTLAFLTFYFLNKNFEVEIPFENKTGYNPDLIINGLNCEVKTLEELDLMKDIEEDGKQFRVHTYGSDLSYDIGTFIASKTRGYKGIKQGDFIFADLTLKSLGRILIDKIRELMKENKKDICKLSELTKNRIIYFAQMYGNCISYYVDVDPTLWEFIKLDETEFQRGKIFGSFLKNET